MVAWLITNKYYISNSFENLKLLFLESAKRHNIELLIFNNLDVIKILSKNNYSKPDFVLFWDKDVKLANYIEHQGIKVFNSSESIRLWLMSVIPRKNMMNRHKCIRETSGER